MEKRPAGFALSDMAEVLAPGAPCRLGDVAVYALRRISLPKKKAFSSLYSVDPTSGTVTRLTRGAFSDREPRAHPQGRFVIFTSNRTGSDQLWRLDRTGEPRALTAFPTGTIGDVELSPDGRLAAVVFTKAQPEGAALPLAAEWVKQGVSSGLPDRLDGAPDEPGDPPPAPESPPRARLHVRAKTREDGIGFLSPYRSDLWIVETATGVATRLTSGTYDLARPAFSPDGTFLVAVATPTEGGADFVQRSNLVRIDVSTRESTTLPGDHGLAMAPSVAPAGDRVAYYFVPEDDLTFRGNVQLRVLDLATGERRSLLDALDRPAGDFVLDDLAGGCFSWLPPLWSEDGADLFVSVSDHGSVRLYRQPSSSPGEGDYVTGRGHAISAPVAFDPGWVSVCGSRGAFTELAFISRAGEVRTLTSHNAALAQRASPRMPEEVTIDKGGVTIHGYYLPPRTLPESGRAPGILLIHGGPHACYGERLYFQMQYLADAGFAVLFTNPRGSHSYGESYSGSIHFHWGDPDAADQLAFTDWLAARPEVDPDRIGVGGGSYGGFMTLLLCGTTTRYRAAVAQRGLYNFVTDAASGDFGHATPVLFGGATPWEEPARYFENSPIRLVGNVKTPMLVIQSEEDHRCYNEQAFELLSALKRQGVPSALLLFPEESHGITRTGRIDRRMEQLRQLEGWFRAWL